MELIKTIIEYIIVFFGIIYVYLIVLMPFSIYSIEMKLNEIEERLKK